MNVLFLSLIDFDTFEERNIYSDVLREFIIKGHKVYCISPVERRKRQNTRLLTFGENKILRLKTGNVQKVNLIEKAFSTLRLEPLFIKGIKKYFSDVKFDLILYATPPVTFAKVVRYVKKRDNAKSYLMLKDIFPQNSVDLGMLKTTGLKGLIYKYFRKKEKTLYSLSDKMGCMSQANVDYIVEHNKDINPEKVELCPNSIEPRDLSVDAKTKFEIRQKYNLPLHKKILVYGGNLGRAQDVAFIVDCLKACEKFEDVYFVVAGSGTERHLIEEYVKNYNPQHLKLFDALPKTEYDQMIACADIGLLFLCHKFTIPNFPSRLLSYCQASLPVLSCVDQATDVGKLAVENKFGWECSSKSVDEFVKTVEKAVNDDLVFMGENSRKFMMQNYLAEQTYNIIVSALTSL